MLWVEAAGGGLWGSFCLVAFVFLPTWIFKWLSCQLHLAKVHSDKFAKIFILPQAANCEWGGGFVSFKQGWWRKRRTMWLADDDGCEAGPGNKKQDIQNILNVKSGYQRRSAWKSNLSTGYLQSNVLMFQLGTHPSLKILGVSVRLNFKAPVRCKNEFKYFKAIVFCEVKISGDWTNPQIYFPNCAASFYFSTFPNLTEGEYQQPRHWWRWWWWISLRRHQCISMQYNYHLT